MASSPRELSISEKELLVYTQQRNYEEAKRLLTDGNVYVDCVDDDGMTALQHAAFKGDYNLCKLFLDCGANVNLSKHVSGYSALTFAALSNEPEVVRLLLEHGALTTTVNSINKTASQMAAFVGNHNVVSIMNNFVPIEQIENFTKVQGLEKEPKLPLTMCGIVHKMAIMTNINPVRLAMYIQANPSLLENSKKVTRLFDILAEKQLKIEGNELLSLKFHHFSYVLSSCHRFLKEEKKTETNRPVKECLNPLIKHWIKGDINGFPVGLEKFLRQDVREYPFMECSLFQQLIRTLAPTKVGDEPSAISIISEAVSGQRGIDNSSACAACGDPNAGKKCSVCKSVQYCDKSCQKLHWFTHKTICERLSKVNSLESQKVDFSSEEKATNTLSDKPSCG